MTAGENSLIKILPISCATVWALTGSDQCKIVQVEVNAEVLEQKVLNLLPMLTPATVNELTTMSGSVVTGLAASMKVTGKPREVREIQQLVRLSMEMCLSHVPADVRQVSVSRLVVE